MRVENRGIRHEWSLPPSDVDIRIDIQRRAVVIARGELDMMTSPDLTKAVDEALSLAPTVLVVDLTEIAFFGSAALLALIEGHRKAGETGVPMRIVGGSTVRRHPDIADPDALLPRYPTLHDALV